MRPASASSIRSLACKRNTARTAISNTFGHIANHNIDGYYSIFFERDADKVVFLDQTLRWPCYGDPTYTFSDVERAVQRRLRATNVIDVFRMREADATHKRELDILARLQAKYGTNREAPSSSPQTSPPQADLFTA